MKRTFVAAVFSTVLLIAGTDFTLAQTPGAAPGPAPGGGQNDGGDPTLDKSRRTVPNNPARLRVKTDGPCGDNTDIALYRMCLKNRVASSSD